MKKGAGRGHWIAAARNHSLRACLLPVPSLVYARSRRPCRGGHRPPVSQGGGAVSRASTARPYRLCPNGRGDKYRKPTPAIFSGGRLYPWVIRPVSRHSTCRTRFRRPGFCRRRGRSSCPSPPPAARPRGRGCSGWTRRAKKGALQRALRLANHL